MKFSLKIILVLLTLSACGQAEPPQLTVSAASNLIPAFEALEPAFEAQSGIDIVYNFASSGSLARQIEQGAPVDVFASADSAYVLRLAEGGHINPATVQPYARGRLAIWRPPGEIVPQSVEDLLADDIERVAIANPNYAPYGIAAREVLLKAGIFEQLQPRLVLGENVRQTLTYAETGDASVALVPLSLLVNLKQGSYLLIPATAHSPLVQSVGISANTQHPAEAQQFIDFILSKQGQAILQSYGYEPVK